MYWLLSDTALSPSPNSNFCQISNLVQESYLLYTVCMHILECMFFVLDVLISLWIKMLLHSWIKSGFQCDFSVMWFPFFRYPPVDTNRPWRSRACPPHRPWPLTRQRPQWRSAPSLPTPLSLWASRSSRHTNNNSLILPLSLSHSLRRPPAHAHPHLILRFSLSITK